MSDNIKLVLMNLLIVLVGFFAYLSWFLDHNTFGLSWGITCSVVFVLNFPFTIAFIIHQRKRREEIDEKNLNQH